MIKIRDKTLLVFVVFDILFLACAGLLIGIPAIGHQQIASSPSLSSVAQVLLLDECPLTAAIANGVCMLIAFAISIPGIFLKENRKLLTIHVWLLIVNALFTLGVGLTIWYTTLQTKANLAPIWDRQSDLVKAMLQFKFECCGYEDATKFVLDTNMCTSAAVALTKGSCVVPFSGFANNFLDIIFTTMFGFCAVDVLLLLSGLCVLKNRAEEARYKLIDEKRGNSNYSYSRL